MTRPLSVHREDGLLSDSDEDQLWGRGRGPLSKISEGSNESTPTTYFSAASGSSRPNPNRKSSGPSVREFMTAQGPMRLPLHLDARSASNTSLDDAQFAQNANGRDASSQHDPQVIQDTLIRKNPEFLKKLVKEFVETGVRGRKLEVLRRDGRAQSAMFRLERQLDAFEVAPEGASKIHRVRLSEVAAVHIGDDPEVQESFAKDLPGVDRSCALLALFDGRCLTFRFMEVGDAERFKLCMKLFADEVQRTGDGTNE
eukprot:gnl/MRDRNA2_/MRDRNA2_141700_c0_seq1.p1 gnl/MRDRNA2_/MRDRNA2_141700_c0~~gnl/MRDRNA2_/MRDRNA2_141700_c0_seq1.p1  ORF type:complete len:273 (+),score=54.90 gnl/MRDRNA2_/MRDRNA2_141700_c0_seq1:52-819(+)